MPQLQQETFIFEALKFKQKFRYQIVRSIQIQKMEKQFPILVLLALVVLAQSQTCPICDQFDRSNSGLSEDQVFVKNQNSIIEPFGAAAIEDIELLEEGHYMIGLKNGSDVEVRYHQGSGSNQHDLLNYTIFTNKTIETPFSAPPGIEVETIETGVVALTYAEAKAYKAIVEHYFTSQNREYQVFSIVKQQTRVIFTFIINGERDLIIDADMINNSEFEIHENVDAAKEVFESLGLAPEIIENYRLASQYEAWIYSNGVALSLMELVDAREIGSVRRFSFKMGIDIVNIYPEAAGPIYEVDVADKVKTSWKSISKTPKYRIVSLDRISNDPFLAAAMKRVEVSIEGQYRVKFKLLKIESDYPRFKLYYEHPQRIISLTVSLTLEPLFMGMSSASIEVGAPQTIDLGGIGSNIGGGRNTSTISVEVELIKRDNIQQLSRDIINKFQILANFYELKEVQEVNEQGQSAYKLIYAISPEYDSSVSYLYFFIVTQSPFKILRQGYERTPSNLFFLNLNDEQIRTDNYIDDLLIEVEQRTPETFEILIAIERFETFYRFIYMNPKTGVNYNYQTRIDLVTGELAAPMVEEEDKSKRGIWGKNKPSDYEVITTAGDLTEYDPNEYKSGSQAPKDIYKYFQVAYDSLVNELRGQKYYILSVRYERKSESAVSVAITVEIGDVVQVFLFEIDIAFIEFTRIKQKESIFPYLKYFLEDLYETDNEFTPKNYEGPFRKASTPGVVYFRFVLPNGQFLYAEATDQDIRDFHDKNVPLRDRDGFGDILKLILKNIGQPEDAFTDLRKIKFGGADAYEFLFPVVPEYNKNLGFPYRVVFQLSEENSPIVREAGYATNNPPTKFYILSDPQIERDNYLPHVLREIEGQIEGDKGVLVSIERDDSHYRFTYRNFRGADQIIAQVRFDIIYSKIVGKGSMNRNKIPALWGDLLENDFDIKSTLKGAIRNTKDFESLKYKPEKYSRFGEIALRKIYERLPKGTQFKILSMRAQPVTDEQNIISFNIFFNGKYHPIAYEIDINRKQLDKMPDQFVNSQLIQLFLEHQQDEDPTKYSIDTLVGIYKPADEKGYLVFRYVTPSGQYYELTIKESELCNYVSCIKPSTISFDEYLTTDAPQKSILGFLAEVGLPLNQVKLIPFEAILKEVNKQISPEEDIYILLVVKNTHGIRVLLKRGEHMYEAIIMITDFVDYGEVELLSYRYIYGFEDLTLNALTDYYSANNIHRPDIQFILKIILGDRLSQVREVHSIRRALRGDGIYYQLTYSDNNDFEIEVEYRYNPAQKSSEMLNYYYATRQYEDISTDDAFQTQRNPSRSLQLQIMNYIFQTLGKPQNTEYDLQNLGKATLRNNVYYLVECEIDSELYRIVLQQVRTGWTVIQWELINEGYTVVEKPSNSLKGYRRAMNIAKRYFTLLHGKPAKMIPQIHRDQDTLFYRIECSNPGEFVLTFKVGRDGKPYFQGIEAQDSSPMNAYYAPELFEGFHWIRYSVAQADPAFGKVEFEIQDQYELPELHVLSTYRRFYSNRVAYFVVYGDNDRNVYLGEYVIYHNGKTEGDFSFVEIPYDGYNAQYCAQMDESRFCSACMRGYYLHGGKCHAKISSCRIQRGNKCLKCIDTAKLTQNALCEGRTLFDGNFSNRYCLMRLGAACNSCAYGFYRENGECHPRNLKCTNWQGKKCVGCMNGYAVNKEQDCVKIPEFCSKWDANVRCLRCAKNFQLIDNSCFQL